MKGGTALGDKRPGVPPEQGAWMRQGSIMLEGVRGECPGS